MCGSEHLTAIVAELEDDMATQLEAIKALPDMGEFDLR